MKVKLSDSEEGPDLIEDEEIREQVAAFIADNPNFDLRINSVFDVNEENEEIDLGSVEDVEEVQQAMAPMQRLLRLVGGNPDAVAGLIVDGLDSSLAIGQIPADDFVASYSALLGGVDAAYAAHSKAKMFGGVSMMTLVDKYQINNQPQIGVLSVGHNGTPPPHADPNLNTLFGNLNYCACEQCLSVYSPAAYYTDILNFLRLGQPSASLPNVYKELMRRRPDLEHIDMTCKNTNTLIPYIDLVIELLERIILKRYDGNPPFFIPDSYQTSGTVKELAAYPEHVYKEFDTVGGIYTWEYLDYEFYKLVYDPPPGVAPLPTVSISNLTTAVFPFNLPFSLPAEETRAYLKHLGYSRYELMKMYQPYSSPTGLTDFDIYSELLGITSAEAAIITDSHSLSADTWLFYGFSGSTVSNFIDPADTSATLLSGTWSDLLKDRLDLLIQQLKISYKQFLQFLTTNFLNKPVSGVRLITVASKDLDHPDTCDLTKLKLVFATGSNAADFFNMLHRFVRLAKTGTMEVFEWDKLFTALEITDLDTTDFGLIGNVFQFTQRIGIKFTELAGWWGYIDIWQYVDYASELLVKQPSIYDLAYRNRAVINTPLPEFTDLGGNDPDSLPSLSLPSTYTGFTAQIAAANKIPESDLLLLLGYMGITDLAGTAVTLEVLSPIYAVTAVCKKFG